MLISKKRIGTNACRGILAASLIMTAVTVRAQDDANKDQEKSATGRRAGDPESRLKDAAQMNAGVVKLSELAVQKAENPELKQFAQSLLDDHKKAQEELQSIAQKKNVTLPTTLDSKCEQQLSKLQGLSGNEFDREFARGALEGHAMAMSHLQQAPSDAAYSPELQQYHQRMMTKVRDHQQQARQVAKAVGLDQTTIASIESRAKEEAAGAPGGAVTGEGARKKESKDFEKKE